MNLLARLLQTAEIEWREPGDKADEQIPRGTGWDMSYEAGSNLWVACYCPVHCTFIVRKCFSVWSPLDRIATVVSHKFADGMASFLKRLQANQQKDISELSRTRRPSRFEPTAFLQLRLKILNGLRVRVPEYRNRSVGCCGLGSTRLWPHCITVLRRFGREGPCKWKPLSPPIGSPRRLWCTLRSRSCRPSARPFLPL
jgi:hypothetical protein